MPSAAATLENLRQQVALFRSEIRKGFRTVGGQIARPARLQAAADGATRTGQVLALFMLGPIIMVSLVLVEVVHTLMADVLLSQDIATSQVPILSFLVTFLTLALLCIVAWGWFQFVRTAGFGRFNFDD